MTPEIEQGDNPLLQLMGVFSNEAAAVTGMKAKLTELGWSDQMAEVMVFHYVFHNPRGNS